jgi:hypothetical protein
MYLMDNAAFYSFNIANVTIGVISTKDSHVVHIIANSINAFVYAIGGFSLAS